MDWDIKEVIGVLMRVLDGGEVSLQEVDDLAFEADGELDEALNDAYVRLREFAHDQELRRNDPGLDREMRGDLQHCLDKIVRASDRRPRMATRDPSSHAVV